MEDQTTSERRSELRRAVIELRARGLSAAAKWAAEQLIGLPSTDDTDCEPSTSSSSDEEDTDILLLAKSYFDLKEYRRVAHVLRTSAGNKARFLRCYSLYLAGEKRKEEERVENGGPLGKEDVTNKDIEAVEAELSNARQQGSADAFALYLYGLVLIDKEQKAEAQACLLESVTAYPCNWAAWQALQVLYSEREVGGEVGLPRHWMRDFFLASLCLEVQENQEALSRLQTLSQQFPESDWIVAQAAVAQYNLRNFDGAQELFEDLIERDPHRVEGMDTHSNILYVQENFPALSHLAHRTAATDKYRPETCCIIGNYYSLKAQHEKAVMYFRRALKLDRHYLSAWTLMGHEYVEMKNTSAAIEAYRRAVELNPRDYRAWYGLGQTYELLRMPFYALYYFRRATQLRPHDARMWCAMGQCYENDQLQSVDKDKMEVAAIRCYRRAVQNKDREGIALHKLAKLHQARAETREAAHYFRMNLERIEAENITGSDQLDALIYLAEYAKATGSLTEAEAYCLQLLDYGAPSKEKAKSLLREIRSLQRHQRSTPAAAAAPAPSAAGSAFTTPVPMPLNALAHNQQEISPFSSDRDASPMSGFGT
ncbi:anaphase-promoting complex component apc8 [Trebouxia sp. C0010 RCD-2024]